MNQEQPVASAIGCHACGNGRVGSCGDASTQELTPKLPWRSSRTRPIADHGLYPWCEDDCPDCPENFEPRMILEIADYADRIEREFEVGSERRRANSLHKLDTLIAALRVFRKGLEEEFAEYDRR